MSDNGPEKKEESAVEKLRDTWKKKDMEYKTQADVARVFHIVAALKDLKDTTNLRWLIGSFTRELRGLELKQQEIGEKEDEERKKEMAEAVAKDAQAAKEAIEKERQKEAQSQGQSAARPAYQSAYVPPERRV